MHFYEEDAFDEKWYKLICGEAFTDPKLRSAVGLLIFARLYYIAMGNKQLGMNALLREEAITEIQRVLRRHTKRSFYSLKKEYQQIPQLRVTAEGLGKVPPVVRTKYWNDPYFLESYVDWRIASANSSKEFTELELRSPRGRYLSDELSKDER